jgi:hypothetical protein
MGQRLWQVGVFWVCHFERKREIPEGIHCPWTIAGLRDSLRPRLRAGLTSFGMTWLLVCHFERKREIPEGIHRPWIIEGLRDSLRPSLRAGLTSFGMTWGRSYWLPNGGHLL